MPNLFVNLPKTISLTGYVVLLYPLSFVIFAIKSKISPEVSSFHLSLCVLYVASGLVPSSSPPSDYLDLSFFFLSISETQQRRHKNIKRKTSTTYLWSKRIKRRVPGLQVNLICCLHTFLLKEFKSWGSEKNQD